MVPAHPGSPGHSPGGRKMVVVVVIVVVVLILVITHTHTHTAVLRPSWILSGTTRVSRYQKGKTNLNFTGARDSEWQWHHLDHMQICISP